jgi:hypothetical protein
MIRAPTTTAATIVALAIVSGCGGDKASPPAAHPPNRAVGRCAGHECRVRVTCNGRVSVLLGAAPLRLRTSKSALRTTIVADFAGSHDDTVVRC